MDFYSKKLLPRLINCACRSNYFSGLRKRIIPQAYGNVIEIGFGSGLNIPFYNKELINKIYAVEPALSFSKLFNKNSVNFPIEIYNIPAEELPFGDNFFDSAVCTFSFCSINNTLKAISELKRVIKPKSKIYFCEHSVSHNHKTASLQNALNPIWKKAFGGCSLNRDIKSCLKNFNFDLSEVEIISHGILNPLGDIQVGAALKK